MAFFNIFKRNKQKKNEFNANRFSGRLDGLAWCILETRDPQYDPQKMEKEPSVIWNLKAFNIANEEEKKVLTKLANLIKEKDKDTDSSDKNETFRIYALGAVEGKKTIYDNLPVSNLLKDENI